METFWSVFFYSFVIHKLIPIKVYYVSIIILFVRLVDHLQLSFWWFPLQFIDPFSLTAKSISISYYLLARLQRQKLTFVSHTG